MKTPRKPESADRCRTLHLQDKASMGPTLIRVDANARIGSGHAMRCLTIAARIRSDKQPVTFAVSDGESYSFLKSLGEEPLMLGGTATELSAADGAALAESAAKIHAKHVLIDSYGVDDAFFNTLSATMSQNAITTYIDDMYTYSTGILEQPHRWAVDNLINYSFYADAGLYEAVYESSDTTLLLGPDYAPIREQFFIKEHAQHEGLERVVVMTGSTNPNHALEHMVVSCRDALPSAHIDIILGHNATFTGQLDRKMSLHRGLTDLSELMHSADLAVSAAGTTLYELWAAKVPTIAIALYQNQVKNLKGFASMENCMGTCFWVPDPPTSLHKAP